VTVPALLLHELGHKTMASSFGLSATFHAAYFWLLAVIVLKLIKFPIIIFVPAYVSISGIANVTQTALISIAGPAVNLVLFAVALIILKTNKRLKNRTTHFWSLTKNINLFLFVFNIIPIPGFDGFTFFNALGKIIGVW
jgi:Zn-dependent protease